MAPLTLRTFPPPHAHAHAHNALTTFLLDLFHWLFKSRSFPKPHSSDFEKESAIVGHYLEQFWHILLTALLTILGTIGFLVLVLRCCVKYDRWQSRHGEVGREVREREDRMVSACVRKGRKVVQRMERERMERIWREEDRRAAVREEYLRRKSILQGRVRDREVGRIGEEIVKGVGEGPAPRLSLERQVSKREVRRGEGTQMLDEEEDLLRKNSQSRRAGGAEARIGNSVWRTASGRTLQRANSIPTRFYGAGSLKQFVLNRGISSTHSHSRSSSSLSSSSSSSSSSKIRPLMVTHDAGLADRLLEREIPNLPKLSFDAEREEVLHLRRAVEDAVLNRDTEGERGRVSRSGFVVGAGAREEHAVEKDTPVRDSREGFTHHGTVIEEGDVEGEEYHTPTSASPSPSSPATSSGSVSRTRHIKDEYPPPPFGAPDAEVKEPLLAPTPLPLLTSVTSIESFVREVGKKASVDAAAARASLDCATATTSIPRAATSLSAREVGDVGEVGEVEGEGKGKLALLPRLSFEVPGGWSPVEMSDEGSGEEEGMARAKMSSCAPQ